MATESDLVEEVRRVDAPRITKPLIFISHDSRDADLAEAFDNLLTDASGGMLSSFRSSDKRGIAGIPFGAEWYRAIMEKLGLATGVVALLTVHSLDRPWLLYEAGVAKGKLNAVVFGLALGIPLDRASSGPFAQFQNCAGDEDSLTKLVLDLMHANLPDASPRREAVQAQALAFQTATQSILDARAQDKTTASPETDDSNSVAKLFEELKVQLRDLGAQIDAQAVRPMGSRPVNSRTVERLFLEAFNAPTAEIQAASWLNAISRVRNDAPWLYESGHDLYRALLSGRQQAISLSARNILRMAEGMASLESHGSLNPDRASSFLSVEFPSMLNYFLPRLEATAAGVGREVAAAPDNDGSDKAGEK